MQPQTGLSTPKTGLNGQKQAVLGCFNPFVPIIDVLLHKRAKILQPLQPKTPLNSVIFWKGG